MTVLFATVMLTVFVIRFVPVVVRVEVQGGNGNLDEQNDTAGAYVERGKRVS